MRGGEKLKVDLGAIRRNFVNDGDRALMTVYLGKHADKYLLAQEIMANLPRKIYWNWAAALLGPAWLFYRKLYSWLIIWLLLGLTVDFVYFAAPRLELIISSEILGILAKYYLPLSLLYLLVTGLSLGCWGTHLYLRHAERLVALYRSKAPASIAAALLEAKGNPGAGRVSAGVLLILFLYALTYWLAKLWVSGSLPV